MVNRWNRQQKLIHAYVALENSAWEANSETWKHLRRPFIDTFSTSDWRDYGEPAYRSLTTVAVYAEDMARLSHRANPEVRRKESASPYAGHYLYVTRQPQYDEFR